MERYIQLTGNDLNTLLENYNYNSNKLSKLINVDRDHLKKKDKEIDDKDIRKFLNTNTQLPYYISLRISHIAVKNNQIDCKFTRTIQNHFVQSQLTKFRNLCRPKLSIAQYSDILILDNGEPCKVNLMKKWTNDRGFKYPIHMKFFLSLYNALEFKDNYKKATLNTDSINILSRKKNKKNKNYKELGEIEKNTNGYEFKIPGQFPEIFKIFAGKSDYELMGNILHNKKNLLNETLASPLKAALTGAAIMGPLGGIVGLVGGITGILLSQIREIPSDKDKRALMGFTLDKISEKIKQDRNKPLSKKDVDEIIKELKEFQKIYKLN